MDNEGTARAVGIILALVGAAAVVWAFRYASPPSPAPSFSLQSSVVYRAETALAVTVAAAIPLLFIGRLLTGRFPDRITTQGAEWQAAAPELVEATSDLRDNMAEIAELTDAHEQRLKQAGI